MEQIVIDSRDRISMQTFGKRRQIQVAISRTCVDFFNCLALEKVDNGLFTLTSYHFDSKGSEFGG